MNILQVLPTISSSYGGPVSVAKDLERESRDAEHCVKVFPTTSSRELGVFGTTLYTPGCADLVRLPSLVVWADIVHIHGLWTLPTLLAALTARAREIPYIISLHGTLNAWARAQRAMRKRLYWRGIEVHNVEHASAVHVLRPHEWRQVRGILPAKTVYSVENGVNLADAEEAGVGFAARAESCSESPTIGFLGRLHEKKGLTLLIESFADLVARWRTADGPKPTLTIVGPESQKGYRRILLELAQQKGIQSRVRVKNARYGLAKWRFLQSCTVFALTSRDEGDSVAVKEALAVGVPVVVTDKCGIEEVEIHGAGRLVTEDPIAISSALHEILGAQRRNSEMSDRAYWLARTRYSTRRMWDRHLAIYRDIIDSTWQSSDWLFRV